MDACGANAGGVVVAMVVGKGGVIAEGFKGVAGTERGLRNRSEGV